MEAITEAALTPAVVFSRGTGEERGPSCEALAEQDGIDEGALPVKCPHPRITAKDALSLA